MGSSCGGDGDGDGKVAAKKIQSPPSRSMASSCGGGAEVSTKRAKLPTSASAGADSEDRLSALHDDMLVLILGHLGSTRAAARTSVLSRRWRRVWALLPDLSLFYTDPHQIGPAIRAHEAAIRSLVVLTRDAGPESVAAWLPLAARRLCGLFCFDNVVWEGSAQEGDDDEAAGQRGAFELPCLERATKVFLRLGFLGLAVPPAGVFSRLTEFFLDGVQLHGPGVLGDAVSWPRCPCLQKLTILDTRVLDNLAIHSDSLQRVELTNVQGLQQLNIVAPALEELRFTNVQGLRQLNIVALALEELKVTRCFLYNQSRPVASITAPQLKTLAWVDAYDPSSVHLGEMRHLRSLRPLFFAVYGDEDDSSNQSCLGLLQHFKVMECLILTLVYMLDIDDYDYMMEDMTMLPDITILQLSVVAKGHAFGASAFHVLRMCSSIKKLMLSFIPPTEVEAQTTCPPGCICSEHQNWETEHLLLNSLKEVEVARMRGSEHEVTFVKKLFNWATSLEKITVVFDESITESVAKEFSQVLRSFARPRVLMEAQYMDMLKRMHVLVPRPR